MEKIKVDKENAAMTYMAFVVSEAAEILLENAFKTNNFTADNLKHEEKMYYKTFVDGLKKVRIGIKGFNAKTIDKYMALDNILETDKIRRDANNLIRYFCYERNTIGTDEDAAKYEETLKAMQVPEETVISKETIERFNMR